LSPLHDHDHSGQSIESPARGQPFGARCGGQALLAAENRSRRRVTPLRGASRALHEFLDVGLSIRLPDRTPIRSGCTKGRIWIFTKNVRKVGGANSVRVRRMPRQAPAARAVGTDRMVAVGHVVPVGVQWAGPLVA
jgi:hypothetical protein